MQLYWCNLFPFLYGNKLYWPKHAFTAVTASTLEVLYCFNYTGIVKLM